MQSPLVQPSAVVALHAVQLVPGLPHCESVGGAAQLPLKQQPPQLWPVVHWASVPQRQAPVLEQTLASARSTAATTPLTSQRVSCELLLPASRWAWA